MLAREVLQVSGTIAGELRWEAIADFCVFWATIEIAKEEQAATEKAVTKEDFQSE